LVPTTASLCCYSQLCYTKRPQQEPERHGAAGAFTRRALSKWGTNGRVRLGLYRAEVAVQVEYGWGGRTMDENWTVVRHKAPSIWGHKPAPG